MQYKINNQILYDFFKGVVNEEFMVNANSEGWSIICGNVENTIAYSGLLKKESFGQYTEGASFSIRSKTKLLDFIKRFKGDVELTVTNSSIELKNQNKDATVQQGYKDLIAPSTIPNIPYDGFLNIKSEVFHEAISNSKLLENNVFEVGVKNNEFYILVRSTDDLIKEKRAVQFKDVAVNLGDPMVEVFNNLEGDVTLFLKEETPLTVAQKNLYMSTKYVIANRTL